MKEDIVYVCDIYKNTTCPKTICHINGGECKHTSKIECALYEEHNEFEGWVDKDVWFRKEKIREDNQWNQQKIKYYTHYSLLNK